jgi:hypothetical protein
MKYIQGNLITIKEFNQHYKGLHDSLEEIFNYKPNQADLNIRDLAGIRLSTLERIKKEIDDIPKDSTLLIAGYQPSRAVGPVTFQQIEDFISQNKIKNGNTSRV